MLNADRTAGDDRFAFDRRESELQETITSKEMQWPTQYDEMGSQQESCGALWHTDVALFGQPAFFLLPLLFLFLSYPGPVFIFYCLFSIPTNFQLSSVTPFRVVTVVYALSRKLRLRPRGSAALTTRHPSVHKSWYWLRRQTAVARLV
jgi:hypothetical protein